MQPPSLAWKMVSRGSSGMLRAAADLRLDGLATVAPRAPTLSMPGVVRVARGLAGVWDRCSAPLGAGVVPTARRRAAGVSSAATAMGSARMWKGDAGMVGPHENVVGVVVSAVDVLVRDDSEG